MRWLRDNADAFVAAAFVPALMAIALIAGCGDDDIVTESGPSVSEQSNRLCSSHGGIKQISQAAYRDTFVVCEDGMSFEVND